jgi:Na+-transporting NADH:ubiquinone oxidoreductase subunit NqrD
VRNSGAWKLAGLLLVVAAAFFLLGYFMIMRFIL